MPAGAVRDNRMRHTMLTELPGSQLRALASRSRLVDPNMNRQPAIVRSVNWCQGGSIIHKCQPSRITMRQDIDRLAVPFSGNLLDQTQTVLPDHPAMFFIFRGNLFGGCQCEGDLSLQRFVPVRLGLSFGDVR